MSTAIFLWGGFFGAIGFGYFMYGKKQGALVPLSCGLALMIFPYFVTNTVLLVIVGSVMSVLPYFWRQ
ncbi:MAG: hypothetical protein ACI8WM_001391 [Burkholderiaceae bacterium]|jgi:hypothetical protein